MRFDIFTLFPEVFPSYLEASILHRAQEMGRLEVAVHNIRDWALDKHQVTDEPPYGGGGGMVMKPEPIFAAVEDILGEHPECPVILMTPQGKLLDQERAERLSSFPRLGLIAGHYEGVDERVREHLVTDELSIGDYVLTGGELAAMVVIDAVTRLVPGVLGDPDGPWDDSHASGLLEYPHYTRPPEFRNWEVPEILLSGDHARVARWRREQALLRTWQRRPDLLKTAQLSEQELEFLERLEEKKTKR